MTAGQETGQHKAFPKVGAKGRNILISLSFLPLISGQDTPLAKPSQKSREQELIDAVPRAHHIVQWSTEQSGKGGKWTGEANGKDLAQA